MIRVHKSFAAVAVIMLAAGQFRLFLLIFASITAHELAHILTAKYFGCRIKGIHLTPLGEMAAIQGLDKINPWKRYVIYFIGPCVNLLIAWAARLFGREDLFLYNAVLGFFNLLPVFPLDGGRLAQLFFGNRFGILRANRTLVKLGRGLGLLLLFPGMVQAVLFPFNITLLCAGMFIRRKNAALPIPLTFEFFKYISTKKTGGLFPVKHFTAPKETAVQSVIERMGWDSTLRVSVNGSELREDEIIDYVLHNGLAGTLEEILNPRRFPVQHQD
jgi:stage IV sporulation protein FB